MEDIIIVTGMSGAGKSKAADFLEDQGYFCIDTIPPVLLPGLLEMFTSPNKDIPSLNSITKLAIVVDIRSKKLIDGFTPALKKIKEEMKLDYKVLFLEASDSVLVNRYRQTRRKHPLTDEMSLVDAIGKERELLHSIRGGATQIIDTTMMALPTFRSEIMTFLERNEEKSLSIFVQSFGFMYGIPTDSDNILDVRFLPNPFWEESLRMKSGLDVEVRDYILSFDETTQFLNKSADIFTYIMPYYIREGKSRLDISIGCTGGRHRSVFVAETLGQMMREQGFKVIIGHRDIDRDPRYKGNEDKK